MHSAIDRERFLVPAGPLAVACAIEGITALCEKYDGDALVCVPVLKHADTTFLSDVWPEEQIKKLAQGKSLHITDKHKVSMCSPSNLSRTDVRDKVIALGLFASPDTIEKLERRLFACRALVIVPWSPDDSARWEKTYSPKIIRAAEKP